MTAPAGTARLYVYRAVRGDGRIVSGRIEAAGAPEAGAELASRGLHPIAVVAADPARPSRAASRRDLAIVFRSLAGLVAAGVPLERAIGATQRLARGDLGPALADVQRRLREGATLGGALAATDGLVPPLVLGMTRAGERGGQLDATLDAVATHLEKEAELIARVRQALAYPALVACAGTVSVLVIGTVVVPRFAAMLGDLGQQLPPATRMLMAASNLLVHHWVPLLAAALLSGCAAAAYLHTPAGRAALHNQVLVLPVIGPIRHALATARLSRALGGMLAAGMPILGALDAAADAAGDEAVRRRVAEARERVAQGVPLARALSDSHALTPLALQLYEVGEASGSLARMVQRAGDVTAAEADRALHTATTLIEPALVIGFGGLVAFVAAALLQAVYSIRPGG